MKKVLGSIIFLLTISCGGVGGSSSFTNNATAVAALGEELKGKFGADSFYTSITIVDSGTTGPIINVTTTEDPSSLKMGEFTYLSGAWEQKADVTLELSDGSKAEDFMFKLGDLVKIDIVGSLVDDAKLRLKKEKDIEPKVKMISINAPDNGDFDSMKYFLSLEPETGGTSFNFYYKMNGDFIEYTY